MPIYTVRDNETNKTVKFQWNLDTPPTDDDMQEVFNVAKDIKTPVSEPEVGKLGRENPNAYAAFKTGEKVLRLPQETATSVLKGMGNVGESINEFMGITPKDEGIRTAI